MSNVIDIQKFLRKKKKLALKATSAYVKHNFHADRYLANPNWYDQILAMYYLDRGIALDIKFERMEFRK